MNIEHIQRKHDPPKTERLYQKMWRAENIKSSLAKLAKISFKNTPTQSPLDCSVMSNTQNISKLSLLSPNKSIQNSTCVQGKCHNCEKMLKYLNQTKNDKKCVQQKYKELLQKYSLISKQNQKLYKRIQQIGKDFQQTNQSIQPYKNNVVLMQQQLDAIKQSIISPHKKSEQNDKMQKQFDERKKTMDFEFNFLKKTHEREQQNNESKLNRLNFVINYMENKNKQLQTQVCELTRANKIMHGIIHQSGYVVQQRQLFHMASQQLYQYKIQYSKQKNQKEYLTRLVEKLRNKIYMLTSLIGYGVVSNIENNDLHQLNTFKQNLEKVNGVQDRLSLDVYGLLSLKNYKSCYGDVKQFANKDDSWSCLYQPNFLVLFQDQQIKNALQQNVTTIIKPDFFLMVRAILDSKYSQFVIQGSKTNRFSDFAYSFIDFFRLRKKQKRIQINSKRNQEENDFMKTNFLLRIFDRKVGYLPQIVTFRQFLIKNAPQDQVYYYLMCRNYLFNGPELDNYINCSDAYNYVSYDRMLARLQQLLQHLDKNSKTIVFNHLNQKKVMKKKVLLIKGNYVLRLLLEVYRKNRKDKIVKLRSIFEQTCRFTKTDYIKFIHFKQILRKNFPTLTYSEICEYYRKSMAIMHTQSNSTFFQAFNASCIQYIFLSQNMINDEKYKKKLAVEMTEGCNYLMELIPDSVTQLGNQSIYQQYVKYMKNKGLNCNVRIKIAQFLLKILQLRLYSLSNSENEQSKLIEIMDSFNSKLIDIINQNFKRRQKYQESLDKASSLICKQFKRKIFQFYSQFVKDIKQQINIENKQCA